MPRVAPVTVSQLQAVAGAFPFGVVLVDEGLNVVFANEVAGPVLGQEPDSLAGRHLSEVIPGDWSIGSGLTDCSPADVLVGRRLTWLWFTTVALSGTDAAPGASAKAYGIVSLVNADDVEKLRQENLRLQESIRDLNAVFESSGEETFVTDGNGTTLMVNSACEAFYGIPASSIIGRNVKDLEKEGMFSPSITPLVLQSRKRVTVVQETKTGRRIVATANPIFDSEGTIVRIVTTSRDITESHELSARLKEAEALAALYLSELQALRQEHTRVDDIVVESPAMRRVMQTVEKIAPFESTVLLQGESGTGKDTVAKIIHRLSPRCSNPFMKVNCGAIPETLMESELFGYVHGAFTGAHREGKVGVIEMANKGTLFMNEIDAIPLHLQVKILHVIQERQFMKVGGTKVIGADIRIVAASNKDLRQLVRQGRFREDLFYRLNVIPVFIPPLRERRQDIAPLATHFLKRTCEKYGIEKAISAAAIDLLSKYRWPGNVRELANTIERAVILSSERSIKPEDLPQDIRADIPTWLSVSGEPESRGPGKVTQSSQGPLSCAAAMDAVEREMLIRAMESGGTTRRAAEILGMSQSSVVRKLKRHGIRPESRP